jgi:hypothetical protein
VSEQIAERVSALVEKGEQVLRTHKPNPPNVIGFPTLSTSAFLEWRTQGLALLSQVAGSGSVYMESFRNSTERAGYTGSAKSGLGVLRAFLEDLRSVPSPRSWTVPNLWRSSIKSARGST